MSEVDVGIGPYKESAPLARHRLWPRRRLGLLAVVIMIILPVVAVSGWVGYLRITGNINVVDPGKVYRSGQLWPWQLESLLKEKGIRTVINLRGENPGSEWYDDEVNITRTASVRYISLPFSASHEPNDALINALTTAMATAQQPILIHCEGGADRSGLASALYSLEQMGETAIEADRQLSFWYGHLPWLFPRTAAMDRTFWRVAQLQPLIEPK
jgi:protein tyrosine phosphatase (PTP) superfamily phosphohydrolase (DUF442 family)